MATITVVTPSGGSAGSVEVDDAVFGVEPNVPLMHQVVTAQLATRRAGTHSTKTRAEVRGGGAKPWKQKGTGRARAGSSTVPNWRGGGVAMGPKPRDYSQRTPKKMKRQALAGALSDRMAEGKVIVVDGWGFDRPRTADAVAALKAIGAEGKILVVIDRADEAATKSFRNLPDVHVLCPGELNTYDVLVSDVVVFTTDTLPAAPAVRSVASRAATAETSIAPALGEGDAEARDAVSVMDDPSIDSDDDGEVNPDDDTPFGPGSAHPLDGGAAPSEEFTIKGNADAMLYHPPSSPFYDRTIAEVWFTTAEAAEAAGFSLPPSMQDDAEGEDSADAATESSEGDES
jgi:large subunit ribosomal protein L4